MNVSLIKPYWDSHYQHWWFLCVCLFFLKIQKGQIACCLTSEILSHIFYIVSMFTNLMCIFDSTGVWGNLLETITRAPIQPSSSWGENQWFSLFLFNLEDLRSHPLSQSWIPSIGSQFHCKPAGKPTSAGVHGCLTKHSFCCVKEAKLNKHMHNKGHLGLLQRDKHSNILEVQIKVFIEGT